MPQDVGEVPLSFGQKARLLIQCVPLAFFASISAIYLIALQQYYGPPPLPFVPFDGLGRMRMAPKAFRAAIVGQPHRIVYSPRSRIVWSAEPQP